MIINIHLDLERGEMFRSWEHFCGHVNVNVVHLYSAISIASEATFVNHLCSAPSQGRLRQCRLGYEHDTLRLLPLPPNAGTQPIRPTCAPSLLYVFV